MSAIKIGEKLNALLHGSTAVRLVVHHGYTVLQGPYTAGLVAEIEEAFRRALPQGNHLEVMAAARERRPAVVYTERRLFADGADRRGGAKYAEELADAEIEAIIARHNTMTSARYEAYRIACEQGLAVVPSDAL